MSSLAIKPILQAIRAVIKNHTPENSQALATAAGLVLMVADSQLLSDDPNSPNYRYRDTGYIADSRKERAASLIAEAKKSGQRLRATDIDWNAIEQNPRQANELIVKSNLFGKTDWQALQNSGMEPAAGFLIDKIYASIGAEPTRPLPKLRGLTANDVIELERQRGDDAQALAKTRKDYAVGLETIRDRLENKMTVVEVLDVLEEIKEELNGGQLSSEQAELMQLLKVKYDEKRKQANDLKKESDAVYQAWHKLGLEISHLKYQQSKRTNRGWKPDPKIDEQIALLAPKEQLAERHYRDYQAKHPELKSIERRYGDGSFTYANDVEWEAIEVSRTMRDVERQAKFNNILSNPATRAWLSFGERFLNLVHYRHFNGSDAFAGHVTNAKAGKIKDWSWADKDKPNTPRQATKQEVGFQLKVADQYERKGGKPIDISGTKALETMIGLRAVQSGNWVLKDPNSAKFHVENTAAAMSDMSDVLGIDVGLLGFGGRLGLAFGARGHGAKGWKDGAAAAHYEPIHRVINLTKMRGGGALAHEWFHALDNIMHEMANQQVSGSKGDFVSMNPDLLPVGMVQDAVKALRSAMLVGASRPLEAHKYTGKDVKLAKHNIDLPRNNVARLIKEAGNAKDAVIQFRHTYEGKLRDKSFKQWLTLAVAYYHEGEAKADERYGRRLATGGLCSSFMAEAVILDEGQQGKYWSTVEEMAARAFQSYIEDKLAESDRKNDYLSAFADNKYHFDALFNIEWKPYPEGEERKAINAAFDKMFVALREQKIFENAVTNEDLMNAIFASSVDEFNSTNGNDTQAIIVAIRTVLAKKTPENLQALADVAGLRIKPIIKYQDGDKLAVSDILPFFNKEIVNAGNDEKVPTPLFVIGTVDALAIDGLSKYLTGFEAGKHSTVRISGRAIKHLHDSRPKLAKRILENIERITLHPSEVLPNHKGTVGERAILVHFDKVLMDDKGDQYATVIELALNGTGVDIMSIQTMPERTLKKPRDLKEILDKELASKDGQHTLDKLAHSHHHVAPEGTRAEADLPRFNEADLNIAQPQENAIHSPPLKKYKSGTTKWKNFCRDASIKYARLYQSYMNNKLDYDNFIKKKELSPLSDDSIKNIESVVGRNFYKWREIDILQYDLKPEYLETKDEFNSTIDDAAHQAATSPHNNLAEPTESQKMAGNYKLGKVTISGLSISIENPQGSTRSGVNAEGKEWSNTMQHHYGYINGTEGADGDHLDVFVVPNTPMDWKGDVYIIDQVDPLTGDFDEHKIIIGAKSHKAAQEIYLANYDADWQGFGDSTELTMPEFKSWLKNGDLSRPISHEFEDRYNDIGGFNFIPAVDFDQTLNAIKAVLANHTPENVKRLAMLTGLTLKQAEPDIELDMFGEPIQNHGFDLFGEPIQDGDDSPVEELPRLAVVELPLSQLTLSQDVPQFKSGADDESGVVEALGGKFDRTGVAPIQVWERADGRLEIISGRHRTDLARRSGEKTIPAQVHKESEGFTAKQAMMLDAELNIRDGQGKVKDYVDYFTHSEISQEEADKRGLLARSIGQRAFTIASKGSEELKTLHRNEIISDQAAADIASIAPNNGAMQAVGLRVLQEHKPLNNALNTIRAVMALTREKGQEPDTFDLFGFDDSALKEAEAMARIASRKQRQIAEQLAAIKGAVKNPKLAAKHGVIVENEADVLAKVQTMTAQKARWDNWSSHADLLAEVRAELTDSHNSIFDEDMDMDELLALGYEEELIAG